MVHRRHVSGLSYPRPYTKARYMMPMTLNDRGVGVLVEPAHGTRTRYVTGCRDECCRRAEREYKREYRKRKRKEKS